MNIINFCTQRALSYSHTKSIYKLNIEICIVYLYPTFNLSKYGYWLRFECLYVSSWSVWEELVVLKQFQYILFRLKKSTHILERTHCISIRKKNRTNRIKIDKLDVTCFIISPFTAQHVSDVSTFIFRSLRLIVDLFYVLYCSGSMCVGVTVWFGWGGVVCLCRLKH